MLALLPKPTPGGVRGKNGGPSSRAMNAMVSASPDTAAVRGSWQEGYKASCGDGFKVILGDCLENAGVTRLIRERRPFPVDFGLLREAPVFSLGQRYIAAGAGEGAYEVRQVPGNALGAYLDGGRIEVFCNVQDAAGDTMNDGAIVVHGSCGDAAGYAMRGGAIFIEKDAGYRCWHPHEGVWGQGAAASSSAGGAAAFWGSTRPGA